MEFLNRIEISHIILIITTLSGYIIAFIQWKLKRKYERNALISEKKYQVYSEVLHKFDEVNTNLRLNSTELIYSSVDVFKTIIKSKSQEEIDNALISFNNKLNEQTRKVFQPLHILTQEQNKLKLICSDTLLQKIDKYITISTKLVLNYQNLLSDIKQTDFNEIEKKFNVIKDDKDWKEIESLFEEIIFLMRKEIGYA